MAAQQKERPLKFFSMFLVVASAVMLPRAFGLVTAESTVVEHALWGGAFGAAGGMLAAILTKLISGKD